MVLALKYFWRLKEEHTQRHEKEHKFTITVYISVFGLTPTTPTTIPLLCFKPAGWVWAELKALAGKPLRAQQSLPSLRTLHCAAKAPCTPTADPL